MTKKKPRQTGPTSFFEWVVGTTVDSATRQGNSKPSRRDTLRIELSTDDEDDTDSLRVTYPRNGRKPTPGVAKVRSKDGMKKVRFEDAPRKSAMKKTKSTKVVTEFETDEEDSEDREKVKKIKKKTKKIVDDSEDEDEPHPTCKCSDCIRQRQKAKKGSQGQLCLKKKTSSDSEDSDSEICVKKNQQEKKKGKKAQSDSEAESTEDIDSESENQKATKKGKKQKDGKKDQAKSSDEPSTEKGKSNKKDKQQQKGDEESKADHKATKKRQQQDGNKKGDYPEGMPGPHPRRPNYIEPVRAEVVQTERVLEGPEDPKPNAYFDAEHNIVRVYHGPVYGGNHSQGLYPKRNPNNRPLPMGAVHPTQNPWFNGFKDGKSQGPEATNVPITQGMPMNAMYPPAHYGYGYPPPYPGYPPGPPPNEGGWNRGAFAQMSGANGPGDKDNSVPNNVGPGSVKVRFHSISMSLRELTIGSLQADKAITTPIARTQSPSAPGSATGALKALKRVTTMATLPRAGVTTGTMASHGDKPRTTVGARAVTAADLGEATRTKTMAQMIGAKTTVPFPLIAGTPPIKPPIRIPGDPTINPTTGVLRNLLQISRLRTMWRLSRPCQGATPGQLLRGAIRLRRLRRAVQWTTRSTMACTSVAGK